MYNTTDILCDRRRGCAGPCDLCDDGSLIYNDGLLEPVDPDHEDRPGRSNGTCPPCPVVPTCEDSDGTRCWRWGFNGTHAFRSCPNNGTQLAQQWDAMSEAFRRAPWATQEVQQNFKSQLVFSNVHCES